MFHLCRDRSIRVACETCCGAMQGAADREMPCMKDVHSASVGDGMVSGISFSRIERWSGDLGPGVVCVCQKVLFSVPSS